MFGLNCFLNISVSAQLGNFVTVALWVKNIIALIFISGTKYDHFSSKTVIIFLVFTHHDVKEKHNTRLNSPWNLDFKWMFLRVNHWQVLIIVSAAHKEEIRSLVIYQVNILLFQLLYHFLTVRIFLNFPISLNWLVLRLLFLTTFGRNWWQCSWQWCLCSLVGYRRY